MSRLSPFLSTVESPISPLGAALATIDVPAAVSPWTPQPPQPPREIEPPAQVDVAQLEADARDRGLAQGLGETAALRARLTELIVELEARRDEVIGPTAELIADAATCVITGWIASVDPRELFIPLVRGWLARASGTTSVRVHPGDVAAITAAIGDAAITVIADDTLVAGEARFRSGALELLHSWDDRLREIRAALTIAADGATP